MDLKCTLKIWNHHFELPLTYAGKKVRKMCQALLLECRNLNGQMKKDANTSPTRKLNQTPIYIEVIF